MTKLVYIEDRFEVFLSVYYLLDFNFSFLNFNAHCQVGEILGTLIKTFKASFLPFFDELSTYLTPMWVSSTTKLNGCANFFSSFSVISCLAFISLFTSLL